MKITKDTFPRHFSLQALDKPKGQNTLPDSTSEESDNDMYQQPSYYFNDDIVYDSGSGSESDSNINHGHGRILDSDSEIEVDLQIPSRSSQREKSQPSTPKHKPISRPPTPTPTSTRRPSISQEIQPIKSIVNVEKHSRSRPKQRQHRGRRRILSNSPSSHSRSP
jgi:hypothetical protein